MAGLTAIYDECECPVCEEDYVDPKLLRCGHIFCYGCILSWLKTGGQKNGCPLCCAAIIHSDKEFSELPNLSALIDQLPTDVSLISMVECKKLLKGDHVCCVCDDNTSASTVCMDCNIKLCQSCSKTHGKFPAFREHVLEELATLTPERLAALRKPSCDVHKERPAELYCPDHQSLVCVLCSSSTHRSCHAVTVLSDFANSERQTLKSQCESLRKIKTSLEKEISLLERKIQDVRAQSSTSKNEVKAICDRLKQSVDKQCQILQARIEADTEAIVSKVCTEKSALSEHQAAVAAHVFVADRLLTTASNGDLLKILPKVMVSLSALESMKVTLSPIKHAVRFDSERLNRLEKALAVFEKSVVTENANHLTPTWFSESHLPMACSSHHIEIFVPRNGTEEPELENQEKPQELSASNNGFASDTVDTPCKEKSLRLILVGRSGVGKSSLGNVLLGRKDVKQNKAHNSLEEGFIVGDGPVTLKEKCCLKFGYNKVLDRSLEIIDTPGLLSKHSADATMASKHLSYTLTLSVPGPHAVLFLIECGDMFTLGCDAEAFNKIKAMFGDGILKHMIIVFTHGEELVIPTEKIRDILPRNMKEVLDLVGNRCTVVRKTKDKKTRSRQLIDLFSKVDEVSANGTKYYTDGVLKKLTATIQEQAIRNAKEELISSEDAFNKIHEYMNDVQTQQKIAKCSVS